ncbi:MAG: DUF885 domain-containing protein [Armatimonadetes bacterium]|nr:MAG: DUF885 domain-containing protein [Armatimonadota bacterium]
MTYRTSKTILLTGAASLVLSPAWGFDPQERPMVSLIEQFRADMGSLSRFYVVSGSPTRKARFEALYDDYRTQLAGVDFAALDLEGKVDYALLSNYLTYHKRELAIRQKEFEEALDLVPFARPIGELEEARKRLEAPDPQKTAAALHKLAQDLKTTRASLEKAPEAERPPKHVVNRAVGLTRQFKDTLARWYGFYSGYDPVFSWWCSTPNKALDQALGEYATFLREKVLGLQPKDEDAIVGSPVGEEALLAELQYARIPYRPSELIEIGEREYEWCLVEMKKAAAELGFGDDWKAAIEHVKGLHVGPGEQTNLVKQLAHEAVDFIESRGILTIPELAKETWRMEMMSPERQKVAPFFLGGEQITVSYPTDTMDHDSKMMAMRGNNIHFARATVHHELIPGHHLQQFMTARHQTHRQLFSTPFWTEGWALYWEMVLWDLGFPKTPENRIGMLFWRMHRCARIVFSLKFHLGEWTPERCIDYLVEKVGHERDNAEAEVRRSFAGDYGPLYQLAYMMGAIQLRALRKELVDSGRMSERDFHDAILKGGNMPIEWVRARLIGVPPKRDEGPTWRFAG